MKWDTPYSDFPSHSEAEWRAQVEKDLRGKAYEELLRRSPDGLKREPIYSSENQTLKEQPLKEHPKWDNVQPILVEDAASANAEALNYLNRGATSLLFYLKGHEDLERLLREIKLEYICLNLVTASRPLALAQSLATIVKSRGLEPGELEGTLNFDPLENLARSGQWFSNESDDFAQLREALAILPAGYKGICVNANLWGHAGATAGQQLGLALAMAYEYVHRLERSDSAGFWLNLAVGSDYFEEIAKLRALRRLWRQWSDEQGFAPREVRLYAESSTRNKSLLDRYNNLIRSTAEGMAAVIGGASELNLLPFDLGNAASTFFGNRLALNQLSILQHESYFHQVRDMARGSYFIEKLTEDLAAVGWKFFTEVEAQGGYLAALKSGWLQKQVEKAAAKEQAAFDRREKVLVGANRYRNTDEKAEPDSFVPHFYLAPQGTTVVQPIPTPRLSEKLEREFLGQATQSK